MQILAYRIHYPPVGTAFVDAKHADEPGGPLEAARALEAEITPLVSIHDQAAAAVSKALLELDPWGRQP